MPSIPSIFPVSGIYNAFNDAGDAVDKNYDKRVVRFLDEFEWYLKAMKNQRKEGTPY